VKKLVAIAVSLLAVNCIIGCSSGEEIPESESIAADLKRAGVNPVGESKNSTMPKADEKPQPPKEGN
jgi:hypothetical protein